MQGSVISKRWIAMFTAVGLVSLLVALFSPAWSGTRGQLNAQVNICGADTGEDPQPALSRVIIVPNPGTVTSGQTLVFQAFACASDNTEITSDVSVTWTASQGTIATDGRYTPPNVSSATNVTVGVTAVHGGVTATTTASVTVSPAPAQAPTATPIPPYTGTLPTPPARPANVQVQQLVRPDQATSVSANDSGGTKVIDVSIPAGVVAAPAFIQVGVLSATDAESTAAIGALPSTFLRVGNKIIKVTMVDAAGTKLTAPLIVPLTIRIPYTDAEAAAVNGALNLKILRYDTVSKGWSPLTTTVDPAGKQLNAQLTSLSVFTLGRTGVVPTPTPRATATPVGARLPSTGGVAPSTSVLIGLLAGGIALVAFGAIVVRRRQNGKI